MFGFLERLHRLQAYRDYGHKAHLGIFDMSKVPESVLNGGNEDMADSVTELDYAELGDNTYILMTAEQRRKLHER